jgi:hypothetical protein
VNDDIANVAQGTLRGTDTNSLLRMYDRLRGVISNSPVQRDRERADKALGRIAKELQKRRATV